MRVIAAIALAMLISLCQQGFAQMQVDGDTLCADEVVEFVDRPAKYVFGAPALLSQLDRHALIPVTHKPTAYPVFIQLLICPSGRFTVDKIETEYRTLEVETRRLLKMVSGFIPAIRGDKAVASYYSMQIFYKPKKKVVLSED